MFDCNTSTWNRKFWLRAHARAGIYIQKGTMWKPQKSVLKNLLLDKAEPCHDIITNWCVADGNSFLHKVKWPTDSTFGEIVQMDVNYMTIKYRKFENICVVLDQSQPQSIFGDTIKGTKI